MEDQLFEFLGNYGVFSLLFGYLLFYVLKQNQIREENYQKIIQEMSLVLPQMSEDIKEIKKSLEV